MTLSKWIAAGLSLALVTACTQPNGAPNSGVMSGGGVNKQDIGTVAGAIGGGVIGHNIGGGRGQTIATIAGTLLGAGIGNSIGRSLDDADLARYHETSQRALENADPGQTLPWKNPQNGHSGTVTPQRVYTSSNGQYCREYQQTITVGGRTQEGHGTACREPDGTWKIVQ